MREMRQGMCDGGNEAAGGADIYARPADRLT